MLFGCTTVHVILNDRIQSTSNDIY